MTVYRIPVFRTEDFTPLPPVEFAFDGQTEQVSVLWKMGARRAMEIFKRYTGSLNNATWCGAPPETVTVCGLNWDNGVATIRYHRDSECRAYAIFTTDEHPVNHTDTPPPADG